MQWIVITSPHSLIGKLSFISVKCMSVRMSKLVIKVPTTNLMTCVRELEQLYHKSCRKTFLSKCHILESMPVYYILQGVSEWTDISKSALRGRKINNFIELWFLVASRGLGICVSSTSFQKNYIGWPQQPPTEKVLKFNMIFHDSSPRNLFSKH